MHLEEVSATVGNKLHGDRCENETHHALQNGHARLAENSLNQSRASQHEVTGDESEHDGNQHREPREHSLALGHQHHHGGNRARASEERTDSVMGRRQACNVRAVAARGPCMSGAWELAVGGSERLDVTQRHAHDTVDVDGLKLCGDCAGVVAGDF